MAFTSWYFLLFFLLFFLLYWYEFNSNIKIQNIFILLSSYFFYAWWDFGFLFILIMASIGGYLLGIQISKSSREKKKKIFLNIGLFISITTLIFLKYYNFLVNSLIVISPSINAYIHTASIIAPIGISFYTFRILSYLLDIYHCKIEPTKSWIIFLNYISFFPSIVSGPIDRASLLLPQFEQERIFNWAQIIDGFRQILWGVFKKLVIANNCAVFVNNIFDNYQSFSGSALVIGTISFSIQIYADFSGYSDIAIGLSNLLGFKITRNFNFPYFSQNIIDFWRKWHISFTSLLTEYVFIPFSIKFRNYDRLGLIAALFLTFIISGFWHGANWTFFWWGILHSFYCIVFILTRSFFKKKEGRSKINIIPVFVKVLSVLTTFSLVSFANIFFRADSVSQAIGFIKIIFSSSFFSIPYLGFHNNEPVIFFVVLFFLIEWIQKGKEHALQIDAIKNPILKVIVYFVIFIVIISFTVDSNQGFIYSQY